jgi:uncharacterized protein (DUF488 family)
VRNRRAVHDHQIRALGTVSRNVASVSSGWLHEGRRYILGHMGTATIWTVGHSTHGLPALVDLLRGQQIDVVADIRSHPFSRRNPQFNQDGLRSGLLAAQIEYVFLGKELGGRPPEPEFYDGDGHVRYSAVARTPRFVSGLERLLTGAASYRVAIMCSEEDPTRCHRRLLVARVLIDRGVIVRHIRGDGQAVAEESLGPQPPDVAQGALFAPAPFFR